MYYNGLSPRGPLGLPVPTVVPGATSGVHDVLLLLLLCLRYVFAADPREYGCFSRQPL